MTNRAARWVAGAAIVALVVPVAVATSTTTAAALAPPPKCSKSAILKALQQAYPDIIGSNITSKVCKGYFAGGSFYVVGNPYDSEYLLFVKRGKWKVANANQENKWCNPNNSAVPSKVKRVVCAS